MSFLSCTPGLWTTFRAGVTPLPQHFHQISYPNYQLPHHFIFWKSYGTYRATTVFYTKMWLNKANCFIEKYFFQSKKLSHVTLGAPFSPRIKAKGYLSSYRNKVIFCTYLMRNNLDQSFRYEWPMVVGVAAKASLWDPHLPSFTFLSGSQS